MNFECKCCVFATDKKSTWKKHLRSKSHKHKIGEDELLLQQIAMKQEEKKDLLAIYQKNKLLLEIRSKLEKIIAKQNRLNIKK